jgi:hypothetical protein
MKKILIACEYSATVRSAFENRGFYAVSCDLLASEVPGNTGSHQEVTRLSYDRPELVPYPVNLLT